LEKFLLHTDKNLTREQIDRRNDGHYDPASEVALRSKQRRQAVRRELAIQNVLRLLIVIAFFGVWYIGTLKWPPIILPTPHNVFQTLWNVRDLVISNGLATLKAVFMGFTLGASLGFGLGFIVAHSRRAEAVLGPFIVGSQALPKTALAPLFVLWFGFGIMPKIILAATICFFPLFENTVVGLRRVDESYLKLFRSAGASTWQVFRYLRLINSTPLILISIRVSLLYALIGVVVGEFISGNEGLGFLVISAQGNFDASLTFAVLVALTLMGLALYGIARAIEERILHHLHLGSGSVGSDSKSKLGN